MKNFIAVAISIADDEVENASVNNIQQQRTNFIKRSTSNITTVVLSIVFPSANRSTLPTKYPTILILKWNRAICFHLPVSGRNCGYVFVEEPANWRQEIHVHCFNCQLASRKQFRVDYGYINEHTLDSIEFWQPSKDGWDKNSFTVSHI